jgi:hypothetical protein
VSTIVHWDQAQYEHLHAHRRFEFMRHDVTFPLEVEADEIYNLAYPASPIHYQHDQDDKDFTAWTLIRRHQALCS